MRDRPHSNPQLALRGRTLNRADEAGLLNRAQGTGAAPRQTARPALLDDLPELITIETGFQQLTVPAGISNLTSPVWCELARIDPHQIGQELFLSGVTIEQLSADTAGGLSAAALPWGDKYGRSAAIVIGTNLPTTPSIEDPALGLVPQWIEAPFHYPGMTADQNHDTEWADIDGVGLNLMQRSKYLMTLGWVTGSATDTYPNARIVPRSFGAFGKRIGFGEVLQVCMVLRKNAFTGTGGFIFGHCNVQLHFGATVGSGQFNDRA